MQEKPEGIIFDLDNTLVLSEEIHFEAIRDVAKDIFVNMDWGFFKENYIGHDIRSIFTSILSYRDVEPTKEKIDRLVEEKEDRLKEILSNKKPKLVPGVQKFLEEVKASKIPYTIASSSAKEEVEFILYRAGLIDYFKKIVTIWGVKNPKPEPDVYLEAARILQADVRRCIAFEDSPSGVLASVAAESFTVGLTTSFEEARLLIINANKVIKDYTEISLGGIIKDFNKWREEVETAKLEGKTKKR